MDRVFLGLAGLLLRIYLGLCPPNPFKTSQNLKDGSSLKYTNRRSKKIELFSSYERLQHIRGVSNNFRQIRTPLQGCYCNPDFGDAEVELLPDDLRLLAG